MQDIAVVVVGTAITGLLAWLLREISRPLRERRRVNRIAQALAAGVQIDYFEQLLGAPHFKNPSPVSAEYYFVHPLFYVQAVTDLQGQVGFFTITTRSKSFAPRLGFAHGYPTLSVRLGRDRFAQVVEEPYGYHASVGARRFWYWETHYFGNPGRYQTYILALNDGGYAEAPELGILLQTLQMDGASDQAKRTALTRLRASATVNTYGEAAPFFEVNSHAVAFGIDKDRVRVLD